jgi:hypothetical protein
MLPQPNFMVSDCERKQGTRAKRRHVQNDDPKRLGGVLVLMFGLGKSRQRKSKGEIRPMPATNPTADAGGRNGLRPPKASHQKEGSRSPQPRLIGNLASQLRERRHLLRESVGRGFAPRLTVWRIGR